MKSLFKLAMGAAIAGALVNLLMKQRHRAHSLDDFADQPDAGTFPTAVVADESSVGEGSGDDRVQLPDDGRVAQGPLNS
jgi:hypothetical protein